MYGGKGIAKGNMIYIFASENEGGPGLIASGVVTSAKAIAKKRGCRAVIALKEPECLRPGGRGLSFHILAPTGEPPAA